MGLDNGYGLGIGSLKPGVCTSTTRPASPYTGQTIYETDTSKTLVYNGSAWVSTGPLTLIETLSPSNVATTQFTTGSFSSTYKFYTIRYALNNTFSFNMRSAGSTITAGNYARWRTGTTTASGAANSYYAGGDTSIPLVNTQSYTYPAFGMIDTQSDCTVSGYQVFNCHQVANQWSGATNFVTLYQALYLANQVYDSLLFTGLSGNLTGTIKLYGWS